MAAGYDPWQANTPFSLGKLDLNLDGMQISQEEKSALRFLLQPLQSALRSLSQLDIGHQERWTSEHGHIEPIATSTELDSAITASMKRMAGPDCTGAVLIVKHQGVWIIKLLTNDPSTLPLYHGN